MTFKSVEPEFTCKVAIKNVEADFTGKVVIKNVEKKPVV